MLYQWRTIMKYVDAEKLKKAINNLDTETCISEEATGFYDAIDKVCDVIDSLQQEMWKPSEEQIMYLAAAVEESNENPVLDSLCHDLQKLL